MALCDDVAWGEVVSGPACHWVWVGCIRFGMCLGGAAVFRRARGIWVRFVRGREACDGLLGGEGSVTRGGRRVAVGPVRWAFFLPFLSSYFSFEIVFLSSDASTIFGSDETHGPNEGRHLQGQRKKAQGGPVTVC